MKTAGRRDCAPYQNRPIRPIYTAKSVKIRDICGDNKIKNVVIFDHAPNLLDEGREI